jgi:2-iminobutanoate/2-iminopropanoate deaminase
MAKDLRAVHHPDKRHVEMPYAPALLVRRGSLLFLSGLTAAPVYHSHPHREEEFDLPPRMHDQAVLVMENLKTTLAAAGCALSDVVSATRYLTDVAEQDDLNAVWASYLGAHRPTTTTVEVSRLATHANCKIEITVIALADSQLRGPDSSDPLASPSAAARKAGPRTPPTAGKRGGKRRR